MKWTVTVKFRYDDGFGSETEPQVKAGVRRLLRFRTKLVRFLDHHVFMDDFIGISWAPSEKIKESLDVLEPRL